MKKLLFIYNAHAGKGQIKQKLSDVINIFSAADFEVVVFSTQYPKHATEIILNTVYQFDLVACCGGDGTLHEVTQGLMALPPEKRRPCGYIPTGTVNDFATSLNISKDIIKAAKDIVNGKLFSYDIGSFNNTFFTYIAAFGAFTDVSYDTPQIAKNIFGKAAYLLNGLKQVGKIEPVKMHIECNGTVIDDEFIIGIITNTFSIGGVIKLTDQRVMLDDGLFEAVFIREPKSPMELQEALIDVKNTNLDSPHFIFVKSSHFLFRSEDDIPWTIDGEYGGLIQEAVIQNHPRAIEFITGGEGALSANENEDEK